MDQREEEKDCWSTCHFLNTRTKFKEEMLEKTLSAEKSEKE
jgi:hypothetical protein